MEDILNSLTKQYLLNEQEFLKYYENAISLLMHNTNPTEEKILIIVGGQSGAGKSRLIPLAKKELKNNAIVIDYDELRKLHPNYKEVNKKHFELAHRILHSDTEKVKDKIIETLIKENYNVIYEGALRNTEGFLKLSRDFKQNDYEIKIDILAVPELESLGSNYLRCAMQLLADEEARWVETKAHTESYEGVIRTIEAFQKENLCDDIRVFIRGKSTPKKIYSKNSNNFNTPIEAIIYGRENNRKKAVKDFIIKYKIVKMIFENKKPELLSKLTEWETLYNEEKEHFKRKIKKR